MPKTGCFVTPKNKPEPISKKQKSSHRHFPGGGKLILTRHGDFITLGGKFPRLTKKDAKARLKEIKRLLLAI
jgi:hypothetical protein